MIAIVEGDDDAGIVRKIRPQAHGVNDVLAALGAPPAKRSTTMRSAAMRSVAMRNAAKRSAVLRSAGF